LGSVVECDGGVAVDEFAVGLISACFVCVSCDDQTELTFPPLG
jgi:hypothetical protein